MPLANRVVDTGRISRIPFRPNLYAAMQSALAPSETFMASRDIWINGLEVPPRITGDPPFQYTEEITITLFHIRDYVVETEIMQTTLTPLVDTDCFILLMFDNMVHIRKNEVYRIEVYFGVTGFYLLLPCMDHITCESVDFTFGAGTAFRIWSNLVTAIMFTVVPVSQNTH